MVKDIKYIIKRVIIGVLISLAIMFLKTNVFALECGMADLEHRNAFEGNATEQSNNQIIQYNFGGNGVKITFDNSYDYYIIKIPITFSVNMQSTYQGGQSTQYIESMATRIISGSDGFFGEVKNGYLQFKTSYSLSITRIDIFVSDIYLNLNDVGLRGILYNRWTIEKYKCGDSTQAQQQTTQAVQEQTNTIKDDSEPSDSDSTGILSNSNMGDDSNSPVSDLITMPITLLTNVSNNINGSCSTWNLGSLFGHNLTLPCINLQSLLGNTLYNLIDMAICLFLAFNVGKLCVTIYNNLTSLKDDYGSMYKAGDN